MPIYETFESVWRDIVEPSRFPAASFAAGTQDEGKEAARARERIVRNVDTESLDRNNAPILFEETRKLLKDLYLPGLLRSERLRDDIRHILGDTQTPLFEHRQNGATAVERFTAHIHQVVQEKPHVLVAYAWVLYMALFAGGRYLRAQLQTAGAEFWAGVESEIGEVNGENNGEKAKRSTMKRSKTSPDALPISVDMSPRPMGFMSSLDNATASRNANRQTRPLIPRRSSTEDSNASINSNNNKEKSPLGLSFFHHPGRYDGSDLKVEFKRRIAELELQLTLKEKEDIVAEAHVIFEFMVEVVGQLDMLFAMSISEPFEKITREPVIPTWLWVKKSLIGSGIKEIFDLLSLRQVLDILLRAVAFIGIVQLFITARNSGRRLLRLGGIGGGDSKVSTASGT